MPSFRRLQEQLAGWIMKRGMKLVTESALATSTTKGKHWFLKMVLNFVGKAEGISNDALEC